jgi:hypothetical protein
MILKLILLSGIYLSTNNDLCQQHANQYDDGTRTTALEITYEGDCAGQGPYTYYCDDEGVCTDHQVEIKILASDEYHWQNLVYPQFKGIMKRESSPNILNASR